MLCKCKQSPVEPGRSLCKACLARKAAAAKRWRQRRQDVGLCSQCGKVPVTPPQTRCDHCRERNVEYARKRRQKANDAGLCTSCQQAAIVPGRTKCADCLAKDAKRTTSRSQARHNAGLCPRCEHPVSGDSYYCDACKAVKATEQRQVRQARKNIGHCTTCGLPIKEGHTLCERCLVAKRDSHRQSLRNASLCIRCEIAQSLSDNDLCQECLELKKERTRRRILAEKGLCVRCGKRQAVGDGRLCKECGTEWYRDRIQRGVCLDCQQPVDKGKKLCPDCRAARTKRYQDPLTPAKRKKIKERDKFRCRICGRQSSLLVHHIDGHGTLDPETRKRRQGNNHPDNLITLCGGCHASITRFVKCSNPQLAIDLIRAQTDTN